MFFVTLFTFMHVFLKIFLKTSCTLICCSSVNLSSCYLRGFSTLSTLYQSSDSYLHSSGFTLGLIYTFRLETIFRILSALFLFVLINLNVSILFISHIWKESFLTLWNIHNNLFRLCHVGINNLCISSYWCYGNFS